MHWVAPSEKKTESDLEKRRWNAADQFRDTTGAGADGALGGNVGLLAGLGALAIPGLGIPEYEAKAYEYPIKAGG